MILKTGNISLVDKITRFQLVVRGLLQTTVSWSQCVIDEPLNISAYLH